MMRRASALILFPALWTSEQMLAPFDPASSPQELVRMATIARQHGDLMTAIADYRLAVALQPKLFDAQIGLGSALAAIGDLEAAIAADRKALDFFPDSAALRVNLGLAYYRKGDLTRARSQFEAVHTAHPDDLNAAVMLAYTYNKLGRPEDALAVLSPLEAGHESDLHLEYALGFAMIETGRQKEGLERVESVAAARRAPDVWMLAAAAQFELRKFRESLADARQAEQLDASFPGVHTAIGKALFAVGELDAAIPEFQAALRADPGDFTANLYLGILYFDKQDFAGAGPLLELAHTIHPEDPLTRLQVARLRIVQDRREEALALLEDLVKSDPDWIDPHIPLAALYFKMHRPEDGRREHDIVRQLEARAPKQVPKNP